MAVPVCWMVLDGAGRCWAVLDGAAVSSRPMERRVVANVPASLHGRVTASRANLRIALHARSRCPQPPARALVQGMLRAAWPADLSRKMRARALGQICSP
ncbi:hypothetical protein PMIN06_010832 [Paraphaeosphaeria minitans]